MNNVIVHKDRWQPKPKTSKANDNQSTQLHKEKKEIHFYKILLH